MTGCYNYSKNLRNKHEQEMLQYSMKGININAIRSEVILNNSILEKEVPEFDSNVQKYLDSYEVFDFQKGNKEINDYINKKKRIKLSKDQRLKKLEAEIADLTKNVKNQVRENEDYKNNKFQESEQEY